MSIFFIILICIFVIFLIFTLILSNRMSKELSFPHYKTYEETIRRSKEDEKSYGDFDSYEKEPFEVLLRDGYVIHGDFYPLDPKKVVIISHGHGDNKYTGIRFLQVFRNLGYSTVIYDLRGHGHNDPCPCTMGLDESKDLIELLETVKNRFPDAEIGLFGLSMGCATTVMTLEHKPDVRFVVADCGYSNLREVCYGVLKTVHAPKFMYYPVDWVNQLRYDYSASEVDPIDALDDNEIPILFIHGTEDKTIPCEQSRQMYERNKGQCKQLHLIPETGHADAWLHDPENYEKIVRDFIENLPN